MIPHSKNRLQYKKQFMNLVLAPNIRIPEEETHKAKGVKNYKCIRSSGQPIGLSSKTAPARRHGSRRFERNGLFRGGEFSGGKDNGLSQWNVALQSECGLS